MAHRLADRLKRIQASQTSASSLVQSLGSGQYQSSAKALPAGRSLSGLSQWSLISDSLYQFTSSFSLEFPSEFDPSPLLLPSLSLALSLARHLPKPLEPIGRERLVFIDLETTGLSTGAGTLAFAFGAGSFLPSGEFSIRQLFLSDYAGEAAFLREILGILRDESVLVSYNGAAFDIGILRSRCILNGMRFPETAHIDLLRVSRRLWARPAGGASLGILEDRVLGQGRSGDIPGSQAPERYFEFLKSGAGEIILPILDHHRRDILSLPALMGKALSLFDQPLLPCFVDGSRLGLCLAALGRPEAELLLKKTLCGELPQAGASFAFRGARCFSRVEAAHILYRLYKKEGRWSEAAAALEAALPIFPLKLEPTDTSFSLRPLPSWAKPQAFYVELSKLYEHRLRAYPVALSWARLALEYELGEPEKQKIQARIDRILGKIKNR